MKNRDYSLFLLFLTLFQILHTMESEVDLFDPQTIKNILKRENAFPDEVINTLERIPDSEKDYLFQIKNSEGKITHIIKTAGGSTNSKLRENEVLCYEIARIAGFEEVVAKSRIVGKENIVISDYYPYDESGIVKTVDEIFEWHHSGHRRCLTNINQTSYDTALLFSFLTYQRNLDSPNIVRVQGENGGADTIKIINFFDSMSEIPILIINKEKKQEQKSEYNILFMPDRQKNRGHSYFFDDQYKTPDASFTILANQMKKLKIKDFTVLFEEFKVPTADIENFNNRLLLLQRIINYELKSTRRNSFLTIIARLWGESGRRCTTVEAYEKMFSYDQTAIDFFDIPVKREEEKQVQNSSLDKRWKVVIGLLLIGFVIWIIHKRSQPVLPQ